MNNALEGICLATPTLTRNAQESIVTYEYLLWYTNGLVQTHGDDTAMVSAFESLQ